LNPLDFYLWETWSPLCMQLLLTTERYFAIALWMFVRLSATTPASLSGCGGPWWDVSRRALNLMEDILGTYYRFTLSVITHKLNVSGHMLVWTFRLIFVRGTSLNLSLTFTLYVELIPRTLFAAQWSRPALSKISYWTWSCPFPNAFWREQIQLRNVV
jgi:hypothetical protein